MWVMSCFDAVAIFHYIGRFSDVLLRISDEVQAATSDDRGWPIGRRACVCAVRAGTKDASWQCCSLDVLSERSGLVAYLSSALVYVSRITRRRSGVSSRSGCANRRCSRILRIVSTNRRRSARRAEARTNNSCKAFRDGVNGGSTMQSAAARRKTSAARLRVCALCAPTGGLMGRLWGARLRACRRQSPLRRSSLGRDV